MVSEFLLVRICSPGRSCPRVTVPATLGTALAQPRGVWMPATPPPGPTCGPGSSLSDAPNLGDITAEGSLAGSSTSPWKAVATLPRPLLIVVSSTAGRRRREPFFDDAQCFCNECSQAGLPSPGLRLAGAALVARGVGHASPSGWCRARRRRPSAFPGPASGRRRSSSCSSAPGLTSALSEACRGGNQAP